MESNSGAGTTPNALVKAAALAWYRRAAAGTLTTPPSPRHPSAHPLVPSSAASPRKTPPHPSPAVTLLDKYEIEWITTQLQRLITSSSSSPSSASSSSDTYSGEELGDQSRAGKERSRRRLFYRQRHATMLCGSVSRDAVVETASKSGAR